jgi:hypothetical protein
VDHDRDDGPLIVPSEDTVLELVLGIVVTAEQVVPKSTSVSK